MDAQWCQMQPYHATMPCVSSLSRPRMIPLQRSSTGCPRQCHGLKILETLDGKYYGTVDSSWINTRDVKNILKALTLGISWNLCFFLCAISFGVIKPTPCIWCVSFRMKLMGYLWPNRTFCVLTLAWTWNKCDLVWGTRDAAKEQLINMRLLMEENPKQPPWDV